MKHREATARHEVTKKRNTKRLKHRNISIEAVKLILSFKPFTS